MTPNATGIVSLDGIRYAVPTEVIAPFKADHGSAQGRLRLNKGLSAFGFGFAAPQFMRFGRVCIVNGLMKLDTDVQSTYTTLPRDCRPGRRLAFGSMQADMSISRTDVSVSRVFAAALMCTLLSRSFS